MLTTKDVFGKDFFGQLQPFTIGFNDTIEQLREAALAANKAVSYPPYNIRQVSDKKFVIEMAVAGFAKSDIEVTLDGNKLIIKGSAKEDTDDGYLFKGIAARNFARSFTLNDKVEVKDAELVNGMLKVWLENIVKTQDAIKKISIKE